MISHAEFEKLIAPIVSSLGYEMYGLELIYGSTIGLRLYVDSPTGIKLDDCEKVTRQVAAVLDVESGLERGAYNLEVSSPGINRKLFNIEHYKRYLGRELKLNLRQPIAGKRNITGKVLEVVASDITLDVDAESIKVDFSNIAHANINDEQVRP